MQHLQLRSFSIENGTLQVSTYKNKHTGTKHISSLPNKKFLGTSAKWNEEVWYNMMMVHPSDSQKTVGDLWAHEFHNGIFTAFSFS